MSEEQEKKKQFEDAMKQVYGSNRSTDSSDNNKELQEKSNDVREILGKDKKNEVKFVQKESEDNKIKDEPKKEVKPLELKDPIVSSNPHIRDHINIPIIMWSVILALMPATMAGIYFFKIKALLIETFSLL